MQDTTW